MFFQLFLAGLDAKGKFASCRSPTGASGFLPVSILTELPNSRGQMKGVLGTGATQLAGGVGEADRKASRDKEMKGSKKDRKSIYAFKTKSVAKFKAFQKDGKGKKEKKDESGFVISGPAEGSMQHVGHLGFDESQGFQAQNLPPELQSVFTQLNELLKMAGYKTIRQSEATFLMEMAMDEMAKQGKLDMPAGSNPVAEKEK